MNIRTGRFWLFQAVFWLIAGVALFLSGTTQMPAFDALVRNLYFLIAGFLSSFFLALAIDQLRGWPLLRLRLTSYFVAYCVAVFCVVVINAISYTLRGLSLDDLSFGQWFAGALNLGLVFAFWSELFIQQIYLDVRDASRPSPVRNKLVVEHRGKLIPLSLDDIGLIVAAGDYVEVHAGDSTYLERATLHALEASVGNERFIRVHRSKLVNVAHVASVMPLGKGRFRIQLRNGAAVESSRAYRDSIRDRLLSGAA
ncbi:MAG: LytTR family DNA-binding domain-containing protein [Woeseiaceae bacterium]|nr:LytTR family DNA-binding domain-containing protein [Woeseiaceae bacterium]